MATYTNLTSLDGLKEGDIVTYDSTTAIDFVGCLCKIELYGIKRQNTGTNSSTITGYSSGGYTSFVIDSSKLPNTILSFNKDSAESGGYRNDLIYGETNDLYYRIAVAGNAGHGWNNNDGGLGGGIIGGDAEGTNNSRGRGGTQTKGGASGYTPDIKSGFGVGASKKVYNNTHIGGYGWYGGGIGLPISSPQGDGGGSGFIIGVSTTEYPDGYLGNDIELQNTIAASITEGVLTQGGSSETSPKMILTIIEAKSVKKRSMFKYYNGTEFIDTVAKYYNGTEFIDCEPHKYTKIRRV